jgi:hypothetical protein
MLTGNEVKGYYWALAAVPPFLKKLVLFAAFLVFFVVFSTKVGAPALVNLQACRTNLIARKRTNSILVTVFDAAFHALSNPTQLNSPLNLYS